MPLNEFRGRFSQFSGTLILDYPFSVREKNRFDVQKGRRDEGELNGERKQENRFYSNESAIRRELFISAHDP